MSCVLPGVEEVLAKFFLFVSALMSVLFPTLDLPMNAYSGLSGFGASLTSVLLITKSADFIFISAFGIIFGTMGTKVLPFKDSDEGKKMQVEKMFDEIAPKYDYLNHLLSMGIDRRWRRRAINMIADSKPSQILDVATGTGDFAIDASEAMIEANIEGIDISRKMLDLGKKKIDRLGLENRIKLKKEDSENLSFEDDLFDTVMCAFGVRNFENLESGLAEMYRVTRHGGNLCILEFSQPKSFPFKQFYSIYFRYILPRIGAMVSRSDTAYSYLPESVRAFPDGSDMLKILNNIGYKNTLCRPLTFGIASIYYGQK